MYGYPYAHLAGVRHECYENDRYTQKCLLSCVLWIFDSMSGNKLVINL